MPIDIDKESELYKAAYHGDISTVRRLLNYSKALINIPGVNHYTPLMLAFSKGHLELAELLIKKYDANIDAVDSRGQSLLFLSIIKNDIASVTWLLEHGANIHIRDMRRCTPLHAAYKASTEIFDTLILAGADIHALDILGYTVFNYACDSRTPLEDRIKYLLKLGAKINQQNVSLKTPLINAIIRDDLTKAKLLISLGADPHVITKDGNAAFHFIANSTNRDIVDFLLKEGLNIDVQNDLGQTPLMIATIANNLIIVSKLIERGAKIDIADTNRETPFSFALKLGHLRLVEIMLKAISIEELSLDNPEKNEAILSCFRATSSTDILDKEKQEIHEYILRAAIKLGHIKTISSLLKEFGKYQKIGAVDEKGRNALMLAVIKGKTDVIEILLKLAIEKTQLIQVDNLGNDALTYAVYQVLACTPSSYSAMEIRLCNLKLLLSNYSIGQLIINKAGKTALMVAASEGSISVVKLLIPYCTKSYLLHQDTDGFLALHYAVGRGELQNCEIILSQYPREQLFTKDTKGTTPLMFAAGLGKISIVKFLLNIGFSEEQCRTEDADRNTAETYALKNGHTKTAKLLVSPKPSKLKQTKEKQETSFFETGLHFKHSFNAKTASELLQAIYQGENSKAKKLLNSTTINLADRSGVTPLLLALEYNNIELAEYLLSKGASIHTGFNGIALINIAAASGNLKLTEWLIKHGADINQASIPEGLNPLIFAIKNSNLPLVNFLLASKDIQVNQCDNECSTPLMHAVNTMNIGVVTALIKHKANPNLSNIYGYTALSYACKIDEIALVDLLVRNGASIAVVDRQNNTLAMIAARYGCIKVLSYLLNIGHPLHGINIKKENLRALALKSLPLPTKSIKNKEMLVKIIDCATQTHEIYQHAKSGNLSEIEKILIRPDANVFGGYGCLTPLMIAAINGHENIVNCLLTKRNEFEQLLIRDQDGKNPLFYAVAGKNEAIVNRLLQNFPKEQLIITASGETALINACNTGFRAAFKGIMPHVDLKYILAAKDNKFTALYSIINNNEYSFLASLLQSFPTEQLFTFQSLVGMTALEFSRMKGCDLLHTGLFRIFQNHKLLQPFWMNSLLDNLLPQPTTSTDEKKSKVEVEIIKTSCPITLSNFGINISIESSTFLAIYNAIVDGDLIVIKRLVKEPNVNCIGSNGLTPFMLSCLRNDEIGKSIYQYFLTLKGNLEAEDPAGLTPLMHAAMQGNVKCLAWLISMGCNPEKCNPAGENLLVMSIKHGQLLTMVILTLLYRKLGKSANFLDGSGKSPLIHACQTQSLPILTRLLNSGVNPNFASRDGYPPLSYSINHFEIFKALVTKGAKLDTLFTDGRNVLMWAAEKGFFNIVEYILTHPSIKDKLKDLLLTPSRLGQTVLMFAATSGNLNIVKFLLSCGHSKEQVLWQDRTQGNALFYAIKTGHYPIIEYLLTCEPKLQFSLINSKGESALNYAARYLSTTMVESLKCFYEKIHKTKVDKETKEGSEVQETKRVMEYLSSPPPPPPLVSSSLAPSSLVPSASTDSTSLKRHLEEPEVEELADAPSTDDKEEGATSGSPKKKLRS